jgi:hypothetical protein
MSDDPLRDLHIANLVTAIDLLTVEFRRYNDHHLPVEIEKREPEFGHANYTNRRQTEQGEELHSFLLTSQEAKQIKARTRRPAKHP